MRPKHMAKAIGIKRIRKRLNVDIYTKVIAYKRTLYQVKKLRQKIIIVFFHSLWLIGLTLILQYVNLVRFDEVNFLKYAALVKHDVFFSDPKPLGDSVLFIDLSRDIQLVADPDLSFQGNDSVQGAKITIKDRSKLALFFKEINRHPNNFRSLLCDVLFVDPAPEDDQLKPAIERAEKLLVPCDRKGSLTIPPIFNLHYGYAQYNLANGKLFTKMPLMYSDSLRNLALMWYEQKTGVKVTRHRGLTRINGKPAFNLVMPELYYRPIDLRRNEEGGHPANIFYLGELLTEKNFFDKYCRDKYIILGDFETDNHSTYSGSMPGSLLLLDTYLTLIYKEPVIKAGWIVILFIFYFWISYFLFIRPEMKFEEIYSKIRTPYLKKIIAKYISYVGLLILVDFISYFYYGTFVSIFYIASYLILLKTMIEKYEPVKVFIRKLFPRKYIRKGILLVSIAFLPPCINAQTFTVKAIQGNVYHNSRLIKNGDTLTDLKRLTADNRQNKIRVLNDRKGSYLVNFINGHPVLKTQKKSSELYEVFIQDFIDKYDKNRMLATKGNFDLLYFFIDASKGKMAIFQNQKLPFFGSKVKPDSSYHFSAILFSTGDSIVKELPMLKDSLYFPAGIFAVNEFFSWKLKVNYRANGVSKEKVITDTPLQSWFLSTQETIGIVKDFSTNWQENYVNETAAKNDVYSYILFSYGSFYRPFLEEIVNKEFTATR